MVASIKERWFGTMDLDRLLPCDVGGLLVVELAGAAFLVLLVLSFLVLLDRLEVHELKQISEHIWLHTLVSNAIHGHSWT